MGTPPRAKRTRHRPHRVAYAHEKARPNRPGFSCTGLIYLVCEGAAGAGAGAGAVRVWPTVVLGAVPADWFASRGQKNSAPMTKTAAAMAAMVPMPIPPRVPVVVRVSRSSLIKSPNCSPFQAIALPKVPKTSRASRTCFGSIGGFFRRMYGASPALRVTKRHQAFCEVLASSYTGTSLVD